jgi:hypothetical protein
MKDTRMSEAWIKRVVTDFPCTLLDTGAIRTCPVRLSFPNIFKKGKPVEAGKEGTYGSCLVFPLQAELGLLYRQAQDVAMAQWPKQMGKLKNPFLAQDDMVQYGGFTPGGVYIRSVAYENQPAVFDQRHVPIVDPARVYPGVWAVCTIRAFAYDKGVNKGVSFGLNSVMVVADDQPLGGSVSDPDHDFAGVQIDAEMQVDSMFGQPSAPADSAAAREEAARRALFG